MISDPTARGDWIAGEVRRYYEANRETWWDRHCGPGWPFGPGTDRDGSHSDEFMLGLINEVGRIGQLAFAESCKRVSNADYEGFGRCDACDKNHHPNQACKAKDIISAE